MRAAIGFVIVVLLTVAPVASEEFYLYGIGRKGPRRAPHLSISASAAIASCKGAGRA
jgi:hypothetical protein